MFQEDNELNREKITHTTRLSVLVASVYIEGIISPAQVPVDHLFLKDVSLIRYYHTIGVFVFVVCVRLLQHIFTR